MPGDEKLLRELVFFIHYKVLKKGPVFPLKKKCPWSFPTPDVNNTAYRNIYTYFTNFNFKQTIYTILRNPREKLLAAANESGD